MSDFFKAPSFTSRKQQKQQQRFATKPYRRNVDREKKGDDDEQHFDHKQTDSHQNIERCAKSPQSHTSKFLHKSTGRLKTLVVLQNSLNSLDHILPFVIFFLTLYVFVFINRCSFCKCNLQSESYVLLFSSFLFACIRIVKYLASTQKWGSKDCSHF